MSPLVRAALKIICVVWGTAVLTAASIVAILWWGGAVSW